MSFFNGLKDFFMPNEDEYAEPTEPVTKKEPEQPAAAAPSPQPSSSYESSSSAYSSASSYTPPVNPAPAPNEPPRNNRVVNIKATTEEGLGFTGKKEGISAQAICCISKALDLMPDDRITGGCSGCPGCAKNAEE